MSPTPDRQAGADGQFRLLDALPQMVWQASCSGELRFANRAWQQYTGLHTLQPGLGFEQALHPDDREAALQAWQACCASGQPFVQAVRMLRPDGSVRWFEIEGRALPEALWLCSCTDIHERVVADDWQQQTLAALQAQHDRARQDARQAEALLALTRLLAHASDEAEVLRVLTDEGVSAAGAAMGATVLASADGQTLEWLSGLGAPETLMQRRTQEVQQNIRFPLTEALLTREHVYVSTREEQLERYPACTLDAAGLRVEACAALPLQVGQQTGALALMFREAQEFSPEQRRFLEVLAGQLGQALERVRLARTEREHHRATELRAQQSVAALKTVMDSIPLILYAVDPHGQLTVVDGQGLAVLGVKQGDLVGRSLWELAHTVPKIVQPTEQALAGTAGQHTFQMAGHDFEGWFVPQPGSGGMIGVLLPITERAQAQRDLLEANEQLRRSNAELERFAHVAAHDLQEPLRTVTSFAGLLHRHYAGQLDSRADRYLNNMVGGAERMKRLVDDLLTYTRLSQDQRPHIPVDLNQVLQHALRLLHGPLQASGASVQAGPLPQVRGDRAQLTTLLYQLIGNALKFRGAEPPVIRLSAARQGGQWQLSVHDNGLGIGAEYRERIFELFERLHTREQYDGNGMGLAVCRKIVQLHGGEIHAEDGTGGEGSTFVFTLPAT
ncbi:ATP-binding protein [Deinococcus sonorensis]|uniref:histidine kinase n=2 Tax=Deinococcus sonorensis TaxID=309891 RepID=A0AAU7UHN6_9DEIO